MASSLGGRLSAGSRPGSPQPDCVVTLELYNLHEIKAKPVYPKDYGNATAVITFKCKSNGGTERTSFAANQVMKDALDNIAKSINDPQASVVQRTGPVSKYADALSKFLRGIGKQVHLHLSGEDVKERDAYWKV